MQEEFTGSQGTQHGEALQKKKLKIGEVKDIRKDPMSSQRQIFQLLKTGY
jgi:hypothetical protein